MKKIVTLSLVALLATSSAVMADKGSGEGITGDQFVQEQFSGESTKAPNKIIKALKAAGLIVSAPVRIPAKTGIKAFKEFWKIGMEIL